MKGGGQDCLKGPGNKLLKETNVTKYTFASLLVKSRISVVSIIKSGSMVYYDARSCNIRPHFLWRNSDLCSMYGRRAHILARRGQMNTTWSIVLAIRYNNLVRCKYNWKGYCKTSLSECNMQFMIAWSNINVWYKRPLFKRWPTSNISYFEYHLSN